MSANYCSSIVRDSTEGSQDRENRNSTQLHGPFRSLRVKNFGWYVYMHIHAMECHLVLVSLVIWDTMDDYGEHCKPGTENNTQSITFICEI